MLDQVVDSERLKRINELAKKAKEVGLTEEEKQEQKVLREAYLSAFRKNFKKQLSGIKIVRPDEEIKS